MQGTTSKWLLGCGIGCAVVIVLGVILCSGGYFLFKGTVDKFQEAEAVIDTLEERFGHAKDYIPPLDGRIAPVRMDVFLAVRDSLLLQGRELSEAIDALSSDAIGDRAEQKDESFGSVMGLVGKGISLVPRVAGYFRLRNELLLSRGMGTGEYTYMYILSYYSLLGKSMRDGPEFPLSGSGSTRGGEAEWRNSNSGDYTSKDVKENREEQIRTDVRRFMIAVFENSLREMEQGTLPRLTAEWRGWIQAELRRLKEDPERVPWQDNLPSGIARSLEPFRPRLEAVYLPVLSSLELQGL